jgi:hypothetical protein
MLHVTGEYDQNYFGEGKEWHLTKDDAIKRANEVRLKKIELLKKQIAKLEKMDFIRDV